MKWMGTLNIKIKRSLFEKMITENHFNDLTFKENSLLKVSIPDHILQQDNTIDVFVEILDMPRFQDKKIIEKLIKIYKEDIHIYESGWSEISGFYDDYSWHYFYDNGKVKGISREEETVLEIDNREVLIDLVKKNNKSYRFIPEKYKYDVAFNLEVINSYDVLRVLPDEMKLNKDILYKCLSSRGYGYHCSVERIFENCSVEEMFLIAMDSDFDFSNSIYLDIPKILFHNKNFALNIFKKNYNFNNEIYNYLSNELRIDKDVIDVYSSNSCCDLKQLDKRIKKTDELIKKMIISNNSNLKYSKYKNNANFIIELIDQNLDVLKYSGSEIKNNYKVVLNSVKKFPFSLEYVSTELKNNIEIVKCAILSTTNNSYILKYVGDRIKIDRDFMKYLLTNNFDILEYSVKEIRDDYDIVLESVKKFPFSLEYASDKLKDNINIVKCAITSSNYNINILKLAGDKIKNDKDFMTMFFNNSLGKHIIVESNTKKFNHILKLTGSEFIIKKIKINTNDNNFKSVISVHECIYYLGNKLLKDIVFIESLISNLIDNSFLE